MVEEKPPSATDSLSSPSCGRSQANDKLQPDQLEDGAAGSKIKIGLQFVCIHVLGLHICHRKSQREGPASSRTGPPCTRGHGGLQKQQAAASTPPHKSASGYSQDCPSRGGSPPSKPKNRGGDRNTKLGDGA